MIAMLLVTDLEFVLEQNYGLNISILPGACIVINGENGIGKTSLLKTLSSLSPPIAGSVLLNEQDIYSNKYEYRKEVMYLPHEDFLDHSKTVEETLTLWAGVYQAGLLALAAAGTFELYDVMETKIAELSCGWRKRVTLSLCLLSQKYIWLLDEPFVNLDKKGEHRLINTIQSRCQNGGIVILTTNTKIEMQNVMEVNLNHVV